MNKTQVAGLRGVFGERTSLGKTALLDKFDEVSKNTNSATRPILSPSDVKELRHYISNKASHGRVQFDQKLLSLILGTEE